MKKTVLITLALAASLQAASPVRKLVLAYAPKDTLNFNLVASYDRVRGWQGASEVEGRVGTRMYNIYSLMGMLGQVEGSQPRPRGEEGVVGRLPRKLYRDSLLINGDQPDMCKVTTLNGDDHSSQEAVLAFLQAKGVEVDQVKLFQNLVVDLDEDQQPERLVAAGQRDPYGEQKKKDEYSLLAVISGGQVVPLVFQSATAEASSPWEDYEVLGAGNLDGQGPAEIVARYSYYEGGGVIVYGREGTDWKPVARSDWGL